VITEQTKVVRDTRPDTTLAQCQTMRLCRCAQELEDRSRDHCPRCGTTLYRT